ncbi:hypothetical protein POM88_054179 [Heracleum sosnowskyi]|uniref:Ubiquitin-like protease family profile domain-containing protein n=1 Tax=Heracleum sosnowskyi TaxID=360622 RepID=A0AAD8GMR9_9APIA|nr:hypothetical protein POM88_054179 [Heracleum sosnowskyi]
MVQELDEGDGQVKKTQELIDEEIDQIFDEDSYVEQFKRNVIELKEGYRRCVTDYVTVLALFPQNAKVEELKEEYAIFFKVFEELSPVSKKLAVCNAIENAAKYSVIETEEDLPSFSLGLSQNISRNLGFEFGTVAQSYIESRFGTKMSEDEYRAGENEGDYVNDAGDMRENNDNDDGVKIRPRREMRATYVQKSPYISRVVDIRRRKISIVERQVWDWLFQNRRNKKETLFECGDLMCTRGHFHSMQEKKLYGPMEMLVNDNDVDAKIKRYALFDDNMDVVLKMVNDLHNKRYEGMEFDMFVFPVYYSGHFYIICYNVKKPSWEIIDNMVLTVPFEEKYGSLPARMHDCFCHWLSAFDMPKEREIKNLKPNVLKKNWQTVDNFIDCGIFVMRHMETYMGNAYRWNSGLPAESVTQRALLDKLRIIYCYMMLTWRGNKKRNSVIQAIANQTKR